MPCVQAPKNQPPANFKGGPFETLDECKDALGTPNGCPCCSKSDCKEKKWCCVGECVTPSCECPEDFSPTITDPKLCCPTGAPYIVGRGNYVDEDGITRFRPGSCCKTIQTFNGQEVCGPGSPIAVPLDPLDFLDTPYANSFCKCPNTELPPLP